MKNHKSEFIDLIIKNDILRFGEFTLKSGRVSPYFFNAGLFNNGLLLSEIGRHYAHVLHEQIQQPFMLYGPAYKGIPLASAASIQLSVSYQTSVPYAFNRKEAKDHGEGGLIVGSPLTGNVIIIDDVITAGTSIKESVEIIRAAGATPAGVAIALDRQEIADGNQISAVEMVKQEFDLPVYSIIGLDDLVGHLEQSDNQFTDAVLAYRSQYSQTRKDD